jgi:hypothetical protein
LADVAFNPDNYTLFNKYLYSYLLFLFTC